MILSKNFRESKVANGRISNQGGITSVPFSDLIDNGFSLSMLYCTPVTGEVRVIIKKDGLEGTCASGKTHLRQGSKITISNVNSTYECNGEVGDISINYGGYYGSYTHEEVKKVLPLKKLLDDRGVQYENIPPLEVLGEELHKATNNLIAELRK